MPVRIRPALALFVVLSTLGCDDTTQFVEPLEAVVYITSGTADDEVLSAVIPRSAIASPPVEVAIPRTATGFQLAADLASIDTVGFVGIVRPERFDVYDAPRALLVDRHRPEASALRGTGGAFLPLLVFSTEALWSDSLDAATVRVGVGGAEQRRTVSRGTATVAAAFEFGADELGLSAMTERIVEVRAEVRGARSVSGLVPVLISTSGADADNPAGGGVRVRVLYRDPTDAGQFVLPVGSGVQALAGGNAVAEQRFYLVLLRAD